MDDLNRNYLVATIMVVAMGIVAIVLVMGDAMDAILPLICIVLLYPCMALGMYMMLESKGYRWLNGIDWRRFSEDEVSSIVCYWGMIFTFSMLAMIIVLSFILRYMIPCVIVMIISIIAMVLPIFIVDKIKTKPALRFGKTSKIAVFLVVSILALAPAVYSVSHNDGSSSVTVEFYDDHFHIKAPMVDETFYYDKVVNLTLDPDFDKGKRIWGYGTNTICSGKFNNAAFGDYTLASFTKVKPCVWFQYEGKYFAFNQSTDEATSKAYEELKSRL